MISVIDSTAVAGRHPFHHMIMSVTPALLGMNHDDTENLMYHQRIYELQ